jgi:hypothetical protein
MFKEYSLIIVSLLSSIPPLSKQYDDALYQVILSSIYVMFNTEN